MEMGIISENGNGNGREWETTCMGMGMTPIPTGICSYCCFSECKLQYSDGAAVDTDHCVFIVSTFCVVEIQVITVKTLLLCEF